MKKVAWNQFLWEIPSGGLGKAQSRPIFFLLLYCWGGEGSWVLGKVKEHGRFSPCYLFIVFVRVEWRGKEWKEPETLSL